MFAAAGMPLIPPELREGPEAVAAARTGGLPDLVRLEDLRGALHLHTTASDGSATALALAAEARRRGLAYIGIADHSQAAAYAGGLDARRLAAQREELRAAEAETGVRCFAGVEADILADGRLDLGPEALAAVDFVVASVHSRLEMAAPEMTRRLLAAVRNPLTTILGHPSGRLLLGREGSAFDEAAVFGEAARCGVVLELNAHPSRIDCSPSAARRARALGARLAIDPDVHHLQGFDHLAHGVWAARRGWLGAADVLNAAPLEEVEAFFAARRARGP